MNMSSIRAISAIAVLLGVAGASQAQVLEFKKNVVPNGNIQGLARSANITSNLGGFSIVINPGPGLASNPDALAAFNRAAAQWAARIYDPITVTIDADLGDLPPDIIGGTSSVVLSGSYNDIRDAMVADAAAAPPAANNAVVANLPTAAQFTAALPVGGSLSGNMIASKANLKALGVPGLDASFGASDALIVFSNNFAFDFDKSNGVGLGLMDFETVATHEIGHALGFFSSVDDADFGAITDMSPNTLDLYRFELGPNIPTNAAEFTNTARNLVPGSESVFADLNSAYLMSTGTNLGDGNQASHWKADELTGVTVGIMDPTLDFGEVLTVSDADFRALDLIGYDVAPVPEPSTLALLAVAVGCCLTGLRRRMAR